MTIFFSELIRIMASFEMHKSGEVKFPHARFLMEEIELGDGNAEWDMAFNALEAGQIPNANSFHSEVKEDIEILVEDVEEFLHLK